MHNSGKYHHYNICGCLAKNFQSFACRFSIREIALFGRFLGPYSSNMIRYCQNSHYRLYSSKKFLKDSSIYRNGTNPNLALLAQLWPLFSSWRSKKISNNAEKHQPLSYAYISKWSIYLLSPFRKKYDYFMQYFYQDISTRKKGGVISQRGRIKIWQILFHPYDFWSTSCKKILVQIFSSFVAIDHKGHLEKF